MKPDFSPALSIRFGTRSATQASTQGYSTTALGAGSNGEEAERKAASFKEAGVAALEEASRFPSSVAPVTALCSVSFGGQEEAGAA